MTWYKKLFLFVCLPTFLIAGISYGVFEYQRPPAEDWPEAAKGDKEADAKPDEDYGGDTKVTVEIDEPADEPELPPETTETPWVTLASGFIGALSGLISAVAMLLNAVARLRRRREA